MTEKEEQEYRVSRQTALRIMQREESEAEIADALYEYNERALCGNGCLMLPGDYVCVCGNCMLGSRGAAINIDPEALAEMIDQGALSKIFDPDSLSRPDFSDKMDEVFAAMGAQRHFHDASCYMAKDGADGKLADAIAVYEPQPGEQYTVRMDEGKAECVPGVPKDVDFYRECSYEEFNPGGTELKKEAEKAKPAGAYEKLVKDYLNNGDVREYGEVRAEDRPGYGKLSPMEKLQAQAEAVDENDMIRKAQAEQEAREAGEAQWSPGMRQGF